MSQAFVRESDFPDEPDFAPPVLLPVGAKNYITLEGARRLRALLDHLLTEVRPPLTRPNRDTDIKLELQRLDRRIRALQQSLRTAEIVTSPREEDGIVRFGATVTVGESNGTQSTYRIVGVDELDPNRGWISWVSPLARALFSAKKGEHVQFRSPSGLQNFEILDVRYEDRSSVAVA